ncbi:hypothetical protein H5410_026353 [Solanum commersonii]|uniref:Uncharacterized protein n=1 Tax=Solanum commersonii TaxID=4109 RepID=A0A9J5YYE3_SOLCO|nr:hypothetical protein H5410_026353 [Solanum commersonii]
MVKFFIIAFVLVLLAFITRMEVEADANGEKPFVVSRLLGGRVSDDVVYPCTNNCSVACCNCNIEVNPPICVQCCYEPAPPSPPPPPPTKFGAPNFV